MQALSNQHRSFAFDLWGYGDSAKAVGRYTLESYVRLLGGFADKLGIVRPFTIVGHSLGAAIALRYAKLEPASVERMALVAMPLSGNHINGKMKVSSASGLLSQAQNKFAAYPEVLMALEKTDAAALDESAHQFERMNLADSLAAVSCPTLLVFGARDTFVRQPETFPGKNGLDGSSSHRVCLGGCNHFPMLEQPAVFNRLLKEFMNHNGENDLAPKDYWRRRTR